MLRIRTIVDIGRSANILRHELKAFCCIASFICFHLSSYAQLEAYYFHGESFGIEQGLNQDVINDFCVDKNGMLWIYTVGSLQLFDGQHFSNMNSVLHDNALYGSFSYGISDELFFINKDKLIRLNPDNYTDSSLHMLTLPESDYTRVPNKIVYENENYLFISNSKDSLYQIEKHALRIITSLKLPVTPWYPFLTSEFNAASLPESKIEFIGEDYGFYELDVKSKEIHPPLQFDPISSILKTAADTFFTLDAKYLNMYVHKQVRHIPLPNAEEFFVRNALMQLSHDKLLVALKNSLYEFDMNEMRWTATYQNTGSIPFKILLPRMMKKDSYGNIYITTFNKGLIKLHPRNKSFEYIGTNEIKKNFIKCVSVSESNNLVLAGTLEDGLLLFDTSGTFKKQIIMFPGGNKHLNIVSIVKISDSRFILLTDDVYSMDIAGDEYSLRKLNGFGYGWASFYNQVIEDRVRNKFYISLYDGLLEINPSPGRDLKYTPAHPLNRSFAVTAFNDGFISAINNNLTLFNASLDTVRTEWSLPGFGYSRCILQYSSNSVLLGTDVGLYLIKTDENIPKPIKLYDRMVYAILPGDKANEFWFSTDLGLFKLNPDLKLTNYSKEIGLQENEFNTNSCYKSTSGKLYFGGINGITSFYPSAVNETSDPITQYISSLTVNNEVLSRFINSSPDTVYEFSHREGNIGFELLGKGNKSPMNYNYQYSMTGLSRDWIDMGRNNKINFQLSPGAYTFYYHIEDAFNPAAAKLNFIKILIHNPFYKRWWFVSSVILAIAGLGIYILRQKKKTQILKLRYDLQLSQKIQKERMRISRELHDNIGAQMATVKRNINFLVSHSSTLSPEQVVNKMENLETISSQINQELRDTIWATQNEYISVSDFIARLKNYVFQLLGPDSSCRVHYTENCDKNVVLGPFLALNLHRICQETINNAVKHAECTDIRIGFEGNSHYLKVTIADNGKGFEMDKLHEGYGLKNIKQRAAMIGAELMHSSTPMHGTSLEIIIDKLEITEIN